VEICSARARDLGSARTLQGGSVMPKGSKKSSTSKKRMASKIEKSSKRRGRPAKTAARIGWATMNKRDAAPKKKRRARK
jgi:hypothetical protein